MGLTFWGRFVNNRKPLRICYIWLRAEVASLTSWPGRGT